MAWYGYALLTALTIALVGILQKRTLQNAHSSEYFMIFSVMKVLLFFFFAKSIAWTVDAPELSWLLLTGVFSGLGFYFVTKALRRLDLSIVAPVLTLDSGVSSLIALIVLHEVLSGRQFLGLFLLVAGTYILELHRQQPSLNVLSRLSRLASPFRDLWHSPGGVFAILATLCFAMSGVVDRVVLRSVTTTTYLAYVLPTIAIMSIIIFASRQGRLEILRRGSRVMLWPILITAALHLLSNVTQAKATALMAIGLVLAMKRLSTLIDVVFSGKLFHEQHLRQKLVASLIMLIGVFFVVL